MREANQGRRAGGRLPPVPRPRTRPTLTLVTLLAVLGCDAAPVRTPAPNLLADPGFEDGGGAWRLGSTPLAFEIADTPVRSGLRAARLRLDHTARPLGRPVRVIGASQDLTPERLPERVGGFYRVERWENESPDTALYLQLVVTVWRDQRTPALAGTGDVPNRQLRYFLAGVASPPYEIANARQTVVSGAPPATGVWVPFELPVREDFERLWGEAPRELAKVGVLFEARWDHREPEAVVDADVYYDDLYVVP